MNPQRGNCTLARLRVVPGMGNTSPKDMDSLLPLMNMVIYSIDKVKKLRLNREVSSPRHRPPTTARLSFPFTLSFPISGQTEGRQKPSSRGGELPETDSRSAPGSGPDPSGGEKEGGEGEDHE